MDDALHKVEQLAREAGELIVAERQKASLSHDFKDGNELVTSADLKADELICSSLMSQFPDTLIKSEESAPGMDVASADKPVWIVDPIDGTVNFAHGHIQSAVSIALAAEGHMQLGVVFNPFTNEMFTAKRGEGAQLNGTSIRVSGETNLRRALIATGFPYEKSGIDPMVERVRVILKHCADIRRLGSAALDICWVAAGRLDGYYESLNLWDHAAASLIAREAGAEVGNFSPVPEGVNPEFHSDYILIASPALFEPLHELLKDTV